MGHMRRLMGTVMEAAWVGNEFQVAADRLPDGSERIKIPVDVLIDDNLIHP